MVLFTRQDSEPTSIAAFSIPRSHPTLYQGTPRGHIIGRFAHPGRSVLASAPMEGSARRLLRVGAHPPGGEGDDDRRGNRRGSARFHAFA